MRRFGTGANVLILFNKPFNVLSQFTDRSLAASGRETLSRYVSGSACLPGRSAGSGQRGAVALNR